MVWNRYQAKGVGQCSASADAGITSRLGTTVNARGDIGLLRIQHEWRASFQRFAVTFVSVSMIEENSVASAQRRFSVSKNVPGETHSWRWIKQMPFHTAARNSRSSALNKPVIRKRCIGRGCRIKECSGIGVHQSPRSRWIERRHIIWIERGRLKVECIFFFFVIRAK